MLAPSACRAHRLRWLNQDDILGHDVSGVGKKCACEDTECTMLWATGCFHCCDCSQGFKEHLGEGGFTYLIAQHAVPQRGSRAHRLTVSTVFRPFCAE